MPEDDVSNADKLHLILIVVHRSRGASQRTGGSSQRGYRGQTSCVSLLEEGRFKLTLGVLSQYFGVLISRSRLCWFRLPKNIL